MVDRRASVDLRPGRPPDSHRLLYVIKFDPMWWGVIAPSLINNGMRGRSACFYVGETGQAVHERFAQYLRGISTWRKEAETVKGLRAQGASPKPRTPVKPSEPMRLISDAKGEADLIAGIDIELVPHLYEKIDPVRVDCAEGEEARLIDTLGHVVRPKAVKTTHVPFFM